MLQLSSSVVMYVIR